jgi:hypothetical protein
MAQRYGLNPGGIAEQPAPNPNAGIEDILRIEAQRIENPHLELPPTPMPIE